MEVEIIIADGRKWFQFILLECQREDESTREISGAMNRKRQCSIINISIIHIPDNIQVRSIMKSQHNYSWYQKVEWTFSEAWRLFNTTPWWQEDRVVFTILHCFFNSPVHSTYMRTRKCWNGLPPTLAALIYLNYYRGFEFSSFIIMLIIIWKLDMDHLFLNPYFLRS